MPFFTDQTGQSLSLSHLPQRIISLVPSQTELLFDLGLDEEIIGITKFCVHPETWFRSKTRVGGTKQLKMEIIHQLQPDLIIANKEENVKEQVEELHRHYPVWTSDIHDLPSAYKMVEQVGAITGKHELALALVEQIKKNFGQHTPQFQTSNLKRQAAYFIWNSPYMIAGGDTFINAMMKEAGLINIFADEKRYPEVSIATLKEMKPDLLLLSSEPFPFKQQHADELKAFLPSAKILLVDGEMFSWYGSRLQYAPAYFAQLRQQIQRISR